ncbi:fructose 1,6-bisphosphatase [Candidatus Bathyarchaeota archaeon]|nr:MAG: fructose 1,6-bisphosphatase [Candidatus Bathyarchaeota archaeon]
MNQINLDVLMEISKIIYRTVHPFLGSREGGKAVGIGFGGDLTRFIDQIAEKAVVEYLKEKGLSCILIGEEGGVQKIGENPEEYLIVDAVDGTTNAVRGINFSSASLAAASKDSLEDVEAAAVINLFDGELYVAEKDKGARLDGKKITTSKASELKNSIVSIDVSSTPERLNRVIPVMKTARRVRSLGAASLEICHVASGALDAYVDLRGKIRTLDFAAAMLILRESGGVFSLLDTDEQMEIPLTELRRFSIVATASERLYSQIVSLI